MKWLPTVKQAASSVALVRQLVSDVLSTFRLKSADPISQIIGSVDIKPCDVDDAVYE